MGVTISHGAFDGAYSAFNSFRRFLLESIGGSYPPHANPNLKHGHWYWNTDNKFSSESHKGLKEFFSHDDCEGEIDPQMCKLVADELEEILPYVKNLAKTEKAYGHILRDGGYVTITERFIEACRLAHKRNEPLVFR